MMTNPNQSHIQNAVLVLNEGRLFEIYVNLP